MLIGVYSFGTCFISIPPAAFTLIPGSRKRGREEWTLDDVVYDHVGMRKHIHSDGLCFFFFFLVLLLMILEWTWVYHNVIRMLSNTILV